MSIPPSYAGKYENSPYYTTKFILLTLILCVNFKALNRLKIVGEVLEYYQKTEIMSS